ncbi:MAG: phosphopantetheine-binding protein [Solirubrobacterales bacterium]
MSPETTTQLTSSVRDLIAENSELELTEAISNDDDLFAAGMQSLDCVRILVAVEDEFEIELPNDRIDRSIFSSVTNLTAVVAEFTSEAG